ncbi:2-dehydropantoate 2-reductase [Dissulfurirhabdus thermomarina]|uniref:2-dehydropantoate 2-reductase n=1 Tax=Dissulfurirhabdus thermomarina TaxID=1765737 RepID=A0A6N9TJE3_DISTH|nr:2-dehydropantoate 2-reductase [Dissulfurirhabdus thermomarina]NDY41365.1 2-dehydropantoate 2-reductase [Dissulfurirhabdus thermomarina]NMX23619.1 2-dehydropantoate 2-reductase [Dissulfurirhabdus thermomarina]
MERTAADSHPAPRIAVVGPGAVGCLLAASLHRAGFQVALLDHRPDRAARLAAGLRVEDPGGGRWEAAPAVSADPARLRPRDWIVIAVKQPDTERAAEAARALSAPGALVISLQNGLGHEAVLARAFAPERVVLGVTAQGATLVGEGRVRHAGRGETRIGPLSPEEMPAAGLAPLAAAFSRAGWPTRVEADIRPLVWRKLLVNVGINAVTALTGLPNGALLDHPETRRLQELAVEEARRVAGALGVPLGLTPEAAAELVQDVCRRTAANLSSMLQDRLRGRDTEVEAINGAVVRLGCEAGVPTPVNEVLCHLVTIQSRLGHPPPGRPAPPA